MTQYICDNNLNYCTNSDRLLIDYIKEMIYKSKTIDIIVSFVQKSGIRLLEEELKYIKDKKIPFRLITGTYMGITDPAALYLLKDILGDHGEIKFYSDTKRSFHPKSYFFETEKERCVYVGSSNISRSALMHGVEWNYRVTYDNDPQSYEGYLREFNEIFSKFSYEVTDEVLAHYSKIRRKPKMQSYNEVLFKEHSNHRILGGEMAAENTQYKVRPFIEPNDAQIEALYSLKKVREEGADKSLVVAATGIGKTYLAAFDSIYYDKVLFVAHRDEILKQAYTTFTTVRGNEGLGFYNGNTKREDARVVFASIQTLSKAYHLEKFEPTYFDYIVVDEFHHSAAETYQKMMSYFKPKFMLGLTATPDRTDNKDIYAYCDYSVAYEVDLFDSINKGYLCPFHYYGIYDGTVNYDNISFINGKYVEKELSKSLSNDQRNALIYKHYKRYGSKRAIGFCSNIEHANYMAKWFESKGIPAKAVHSKSGNRDEAIEELKQGAIKVIFAVDIFNEGIDIKAIDLILFLRPTESAIVFLQQLGRGLRLDKEKDFLTVLDFVGNYKKVNMLPLLLSGKNYQRNSDKIDIKNILSNREFPDGCLVNFDMAIIDIFERFNQEKRKIQDRIIDEYHRVKGDLNKIPSRTEFFKYLDDAIYIEMKKKSKFNVFKDYIGFVSSIEGHYCESILGTVAEDFITMIENTSMNKLYKLPVLLAFLNQGEILMTLSEEDISRNFKDFYKNGQNALDMLKDKSTRDFRSWSDKRFVDLAFKNPVKFLYKSSGAFFELEDKSFGLAKALKEYIHDETFIDQFRDVIEYKRLRFLKDNLLKKEETIIKLVKGEIL